MKALPLATREEYDEARNYIRRVYMKGKHPFEFLAIEGYVNYLEQEQAKLKEQLLKAEATIPHGELPVETDIA